MSILERIRSVSEALKAQLPSMPEVGVVLGSGLGGFAERVEEAVRIAYSDLPHFPVSTVEGHAGCFVAGIVGGCRVLVMAGRFHYYEGYGMEDVTLGIRVMAALGIRRVILSNASGGVRPDFKPGDIMLIEDHINLLPNPLIGPNHAELGVRFPSMSDAYSVQLRAIAVEEARVLGVELVKGCYVGTTGPTFETPREYNFYRTIGGDAVGMSTVPEVIVARHGGMEVLAFSVISNVGGLERRDEITHEEVQEVGKRAGEQLSALLEKVLERIAQAVED